MKNHGGSEDNIANMGVNCNCLRFLFMDEIEACGLKLISDVEKATTKKTGKLFRWDARSQVPRVFGYGQAVLECAKASSTTGMFWLTGHREALQHWHHSQPRVFHLDVNKKVAGTHAFRNCWMIAEKGK